MTRELRHAHALFIEAAEAISEAGKWDATVREETVHRTHSVQLWLVNLKEPDKEALSLTVWLATPRKDPTRVVKGYVTEGLTPISTVETWAPKKCAPEVARQTAKTILSVFLSFYGA